MRSRKLIGPTLALGCAYDRLGAVGRGGYRARSAAVIWRTMSDPLRICFWTAATFSCPALLRALPGVFIV